MPQHDHARWRHSHRFETGGEAAAERRTRIVLAITLAMMIVEVGAGYAFRSMALLADGWHMSTHAGAMGIAAFAYGFARRKANSAEFTFGTGKVGSLAGYTSAIVLGLIALLIVWQSVQHLLAPEPISFDEALPIAAIGLLVNLGSARILGGGHAAGHHHGNDGDHDHHDHHDHRHHTDHNLRAAYVHVLADALTSVLAIAALLMGKYLGWTWMDPLMGIVGAAVIVSWSYGLIRQSGRVLLDRSGDHELEIEVRAAIESDPDNEISDLHLWRVGPDHWAAILSVVSHHPHEPEHYKARLAHIHELSHVTVEVHPCASA